MNDLHNRLVEVIRVKSQKNMMLVDLVNESKISKGSWGNMLGFRQRPTAEMIEFVCKKWPEMAYWIGTGALPKSGLIHKRPNEPEQFKISELVKIEPKNWTTSQQIFIMKQGVIENEYDAGKVISRNACKFLTECAESGMLLEEYSQDLLATLTKINTNPKALEKHQAFQIFSAEEKQKYAAIQLENAFAAITEVRKIIDNKD
jgi:hypothetical protein